MDNEKKKKYSSVKPSEFAAAQIGSELSKNAINASNEAINGMNLFRDIAKEKFNVPIDQKKGNFFEYIEACKFNIDSAEKGKSIRAVLTHAIGKPHDPADILLVDNDKVVEEVQAKVYSNDTELMKQLLDPKYKHMQKLVTSDKEERIKELAKKRMVPGSINEERYENVYNTVTGKLKSDAEGVSSKGTSEAELMKAAEDPNAYAKRIEFHQFTKEVAVVAANQAVCSMVVGGAISALKNGFDVLNDRKKLDEAIADITKDIVKSGVRGGATGILSSLIRIGATKKSIPLLSEASSAIALASGMLDIGIAVYSYALGEIDEKGLKEKLTEVGVKTISTVYVSKAVELALGVSGVFIPIAAYTLSYFIYASCKNIYTNAKLNAEQANRVAALYEEAAKEIRNQRLEIQKQIEIYIKKQRDLFNNFIENIEYAMETNNFDVAIASMDNFALNFGKKIKYTDFGEFKEMMTSKDDLII